MVSITNKQERKKKKIKFDSGRLFFSPLRHRLLFFKELITKTPLLQKVLHYLDIIKIF